MASVALIAEAIQIVFRSGVKNTSFFAYGVCFFLIGMSGSACGRFDPAETMTLQAQEPETASEGCVTHELQGTGSAKDPYIIQHDAAKCTQLRYEYEGEALEKHFEVRGLQAKKRYRFAIHRLSQSGSMQFKPKQMLPGIVSSNIVMRLSGNFTTNFISDKEGGFSFTLVVEKEAKYAFSIGIASKRDADKSHLHTIDLQKRMQRMRERMQRRLQKLEQQRQERRKRWEQKRQEKRKKKPLRRQHGPVDEV